MVEQQRVPWGLQPPDGTPAAWGARAIYEWSRFSNSYYIDILCDRRGKFGDDKELWDWINEVGIVRLREEVNKRRLKTDSEEVVEIRDDGFVIAASPKGSYGYLYIGAWREQRAEKKETAQGA